MSNIKVQGNVSGTGSLTIAAPNTNTDRTLTLPDESGTLLTDSGAISVSTSAPDNSVVVGASGNLGIGTSSPNASYRVSIQGSSTVAAGFYLNDANASRVGSIYYSLGNTVFYDVTNSAERARIDSSGNLLVGTTSTPSGSVGGAGFIRESVGRSTLYCATTSTGSTGLVNFYNPNGNVGYIATSGSATTYATSSDYRLKNTVEPMVGALEKVAALKPCTYKWNADGSYGEGFIAHELAEIVPQAVVGEKDAVDADGNPVYQGIDTSFLVATLTAAIQEQQAIITQLQADVAALKGAA